MCGWTLPSFINDASNFRSWEFLLRWTVPMEIYSEHFSIKSKHMAHRSEANGYTTFAHPLKSSCRRFPFVSMTRSYWHCVDECFPIIGNNMVGTQGFHKSKILAWTNCRNNCAMCFAIWTAKCPTPPEEPLISTVSPFLSLPCVINPWSALIRQLVHQPLKK